MNAPRIPGESIAAATQVSGVIVDRDDRSAMVRDDYGRAHADGELGAGLSMLEHATRALSMALFHVERAIAQGSGQAPDLVQLANLSREVAGIAPRVEAATTKLTAKVGA